MKHLIGKTVLITGGTGFLGRLLVDHLLTEDYKVKKVVVYSRRWDDQEKLLAKHSDPRLRAISGDINDYRAMKSALAGVDVAIHTAAYKAAVMGEYNTPEVVRVNILGSMNFMNAAIASGVSHVMAVSSDKATNAANAYGRSKAMMESMMVNANNLGGTKFSVARYGNVAGSTGSVIPKFHAMLQDFGTKIPVTEPNMTRFWFLPQDVPQYIMRCIFSMVGGETFIPKLKSSTIGELVDGFLNYYNTNQGRVYLAGRQPGEKCHEAMIAPEEGHRVLDQGWTYMLKPELPFWNAKYKGEEVDMRNGYTSENAPRMTEMEIVEMISNCRDI